MDEPSRQAEMSTGNTSTQGASKDTNQEGATEMPKTDSQGVITDGDIFLLRRWMRRKKVLRSIGSLNVRVIG